MLIKRQDVIDAISTWDKFGIDERNRVVSWHEGLEPYVKLRDVVWAIEKLPSAQRKGKWMPHPNADCPEWDVCTCCGVGCKRREYGEENGKTWVTEYSYQYCPNCGASMVRGEEDE